MLDPSREAQKAFYGDPRRDVEGWRGQDFLHRIYTALDTPSDVEDFSIHPRDRDRDAQTAREFFARVKTISHADGGEAIEEMLNVEFDRSNWFGGLTFRTTKYDDMTGVDAVIEWDEADQYGFVPRLAVDFSGSSNAGRVAEKLEKLVNGTRVKYFRSQIEEDEDGNEAEMTLEKMPTVVLGIDAALAEGIGQYALLHKTTTPYKKERLPSRLFAEHPIRQLLLEQAAQQLDLQVRKEAVRLEAVFPRLYDLSERGEQAFQAYRDLVARPYRLETLVDVLEPITQSLRGVNERIESSAPRGSFQSGDGKLPPSPIQVLIRWRDLVAVRELVQKKLAETKRAANAAEVRKWRDASQTHALLARAA